MFAGLVRLVVNHADHGRQKNKTRQLFRKLTRWSSSLFLVAAQPSTKPSCTTACVGHQCVPPRHGGSTAEVIRFAPRCGHSQHVDGPPELPSTPRRSLRLSYRRGSPAMSPRIFSDSKHTNDLPNFVVFSTVVPKSYSRCWSLSKDMDF